MAGTAPTTDTLGWGVAGRLLGTIQSFGDGFAARVRAGRYGEQMAQILSGKQFTLAEEGSYFTCRTPTVGTGIAGVTSLTTYTATSPFLIVFNNNPVGGKNVIPDYLSLKCSATAASTSSLHLVTVLDSTQRYSSAGSGGAGTNVATPLNGPYATNMGALGASQALIYAGALVATAASPNVRIISNKLVRQQIPVVLDEYVINFGTDGVSPSLPPSALSAAVAAVSTIAHAPVVIAPQTCMLVYYFGAAMGAAPSFELDFGYAER